MRIEVLKELAKKVVDERGIDKKTEGFLFEELTRSELKEFVVHLRRELAKRTLVVTSTSSLNDKTKKSLLKNFEKQYIKNKIDPKVGAGLVVKNNDDIIDMSVMGQVRRFIRTIE